MVREPGSLIDRGYKREREKREREREKEKKKDGQKERNIEKRRD